MKKSVLVLVGLFMLSTSAAYAHCGTCGVGDKGSAKGSLKEKAGKMMEKKMDRMTSALGLSDEQASQLKTLMEEKKAKKMSIKQDMHEKMDEVKADFEGKVGAILDADQMKKFEKMHDEKGSKKGSGKDGHKKGHKDHDGHGH